jgi:hypothetical protein
MSTETNNTNTIPTMLPADAPNLRVTTGEGTASVEFLSVADSQAVAHSADVQPYPTAAEFSAEIEGHNKAIADIQAKLGEQNFDPRTGQVKGQRYEGDERRRLELQLTSRQAALNFTSFNLSRAHAAAATRAEARLKDAAEGQPDLGASPLVQGARREALIAATADDLGADNKPIGRVKAAQLVDAELARERVAARVRGSR